MTVKTTRWVILVIGTLLGAYGWATYNPVAFVGLALMVLAGALYLTRHRGPR
ncbi:hypothetical protein SAMN05192555_101374 [Franzmannia pantelleriensis]|uniref:Uncharacterized protein n=1 Tax=Franzmannia pantelleriensis TaxID=48727 RepID=A0A1G9FD55_9GAMM|nr:hypothetical protein [Halomonas pantelleriensis]SDK86318.1 hypothetical protein SAMN05192555_101374 [Halomonas pantelleriensis]